MSNPRIAILGTRGIPAQYGGFETFAEQLSLRLVDSGIDVTVYCETQPGTKLSNRYQGIDLVHILAPRLGPLTTINFDLRCLWHARRGFDVVYMLGYGASAFCFIPRLWGSDVWINMDGIEWARSKWNSLAKIWFRIMESLAMRTSTLAIADAEAIRDHLVNRHRGTPPIEVIPYGTDLVTDPPDTTLLEKYAVKPGCYYLVVCRLEPENHIHEIVKGYCLTDSEYPLVIVGDDKSGTTYVDELLRVTDERVRFIGTVFEAERLQAIRWYCRGYLHGHSVGGTNPSLLEALGCGNRVIAHDNPFNREVARSNALYFRHSEDVAERVGKLDNNPPTEADREASFEIARARYDWDDIAKSYEQLVRESHSKNDSESHSVKQT